MERNREIIQAFIVARNNYLNLVQLPFVGGGTITNSKDFIVPYKFTARESRNLKMLVNKFLGYSKFSDVMSNEYSRLHEFIMNYREYDMDSIKEGIVLFVAVTFAHQMREYDKLPHNTLH